MSVAGSTLLVVHHVPNTESTATDDDKNEQDNDDHHTATSTSGLFLTSSSWLATIADILLLFLDTVGTGTDLLSIVLLNHSLVSIAEVSSIEHTSSWVLWFDILTDITITSLSKRKSVACVGVVIVGSTLELTELNGGLIGQSSDSTDLQESELES